MDILNELAVTALIIITPDYPEYKQVDITCTHEQTIEMFEFVQDQRITYTVIPVEIKPKFASNLCGKQFTMGYNVNTDIFLKQFRNKLKKSQ